jgi:hypothetical protein
MYQAAIDQFKLAETCLHLAIPRRSASDQIMMARIALHTGRALRQYADGMAE